MVCLEANKARLDLPPFEQQKPTSARKARALMDLSGPPPERTVALP